MLRTLCQWKGVEVIEGEICPDHIHMLVSVPPVKFRAMPKNEIPPVMRVDNYLIRY